MPTHTPAPWRTSSQSPLILKADSGCDDVVGESRELIGSMHSAEDAAFVLRCVNSHDELMAVLKHLVHWHDQLSPADIKRAKDVIAKADVQPAQFLGMSDDAEPMARYFIPGGL